MVFRTACLPTCRHTADSPTILSAAQFRSTDKQTFVQFENFLPLKSGVRKIWRLGRRNEQPVTQSGPTIRQSKQLLQRSELPVAGFVRATAEEGFLLHQGAAQHHASGRACLQSPHLTQSGEAQNKRVDRSPNAWPHERKPACIPMYQKP